MKEFADRLKALMVEQNLTNEHVARTCKVSVGTVQRWKAGESTPHALAQESVFRILNL